MASMAIGALLDLPWPTSRRGWLKLLAGLVLAAAVFLMLAALSELLPYGRSWTSLPLLLALGAYVWALVVISDHGAVERRGAERERERIAREQADRLEEASEDV
jgi:hypothetical protein